MRGMSAALYLLAAIVASMASAFAQDPSQPSRQFIEALAARATQINAADLAVPQTRSQFRRLVQEGFAVDGIARFVLGANWRRITEAERAEYLTLFESILVDTALRRFRQAPDFRLEILSATRLSSARSEERSAIVQTRLWLSEVSAVRIDWRVASSRNVRRITDVVVEGVSMATTYRDEFRSIARRHGVQGLLAELRRRREEISAEAAANAPG